MAIQRTVQDYQLKWYQVTLDTISSIPLSYEQFIHIKY